MSEPKTFDQIIEKYFSKSDIHPARATKSRILNKCDIGIGTLDKPLADFRLGWRRMAVMEMGAVESSTDNAVSDVLLQYMNSHEPVTHFLHPRTMMSWGGDL